MSDSATTLGDLFDRSCHLLKPVSETHQLDAEILITELGHLQKHHLILEKNRIIPAEITEQITRAVKRRINGEPIAYITGKRWFYKHQFCVTPAVLIPRPETELLVERVLKRHKKHPIESLLDMCTGSGCIGISIASEIPSLSVILSDISTDALAIASQNSHTILKDKIRLIQSDLYENISEKFDIITVNPPYLTQNDMENREIPVQYEPEMALDGGKNGLLLIGEILQNASRFLNKDGILIMEIGAGQVPEIKPLIPSDLKMVEIIKDYAHIERHLLFCSISS
ncbi:peptide chain release factor N(5)-glutamine methyltransferase [bacterium]|nr:peptide chain release factor N(5)-glutamine methyltransferase [bacterium]